MTIKRSVFFYFLLLIWQTSAAQVAINATGSAPDANAGLDISFTNKGFLPPRLTSVQRDAITGVIPPGLTIYNVTTHCMEFYEYGVWQSAGCAVCPSLASPTASTHDAGSVQIVWNWSAVPGASGYKWNTEDNYATANENGTGTTYTLTGLSPSTSYTLYVWAYNECSHSVSTELTQTTLWECGYPIVDSRDANSYTTVMIGSQCWMSQNLAYLPSVYPPSSESESVPLMYVYGYSGLNTSAAKSTPDYITYGALYNWPAVMQGAGSSNDVPSGVQGICMEGWHLPSEAEMEVLATTLGGGLVAGGAMKTTSGWYEPNVGATNASGFNGIPAGVMENGNFFVQGGNLSLWGTTGISQSAAYARGLNNYSAAFSGFSQNMKRWAFSVRCVKND